MAMRVERVSYRSGLSVARGTTIDAYLSEKDNESLYDNWRSEWAAPYEFHGGIKAISCEMVLDVPEQEFKKAFKNKSQAKRIREAALNNAGR